MHLTRLILNPQNREVQRDIADCQRMHVRLLGMFPGLYVSTDTVKPRESFGLLYRLERDPQTNLITMLVQSKQEPDYANAKFPPGYLLSTDLENPASKNMDPVFNSIQEGVQFQFRLKVNPTKRLPKDKPNDKLAGKRVALYKWADQVDWLLRKADAGGFKLITIDTNCFLNLVPDGIIAPSGTIEGKRHGDGSKMTFTGVTVEGHLEITNRKKFIDMLEQGIGSGKGYGFGLLSLAPIS